MGKISVIIPVYNRPEEVKRAVKSVLRQTYADFEMLIIDDGSTDRTAKVCDELVKNDKRIRVMHRKNFGVSESRNVGISEAKGEFIFFLDSDDKLAEDAFEVMMKEMDEKTEIVEGGYVRIKDGNETECVPEKRTVTGRGIEELRRNILESGRIDTKEFGAVRWSCNKLIRKKSLGKVRFDTELYLLEDGLFIFEVLENVKCVKIIDKVTYYYMVNELSSSMRLHKDQLEQNQKIAQKVKTLAKGNKVYQQGYCAVVLECLMSYMARLARSGASGGEFVKKVRGLMKEEMYRQAVEKIDTGRLGKKAKITVWGLKHGMVRVLYMGLKIKG